MAAAALASLSLSCRLHWLRRWHPIWPRFVSPFTLHAVFVLALRDGAAWLQQQTARRPTHIALRSTPRRSCRGGLLRRCRSWAAFASPDAACVGASPAAAPQLRRSSRYCYAVAALSQSRSAPAPRLHAGFAVTAFSLEAASPLSADCLVGATRCSMAAPHGTRLAAAPSLRVKQPQPTRSAVCKLLILSGCARCLSPRRQAGTPSGGIGCCAPRGLRGPFAIHAAPSAGA